MSISKNKWYNYFLFPGAKKYLIAVIICLIISSFLGMKMPEFISDLSANFSDKSAFNKSLELLAYLFIGIYFNRLCYQLILNKYVTDLIQSVRSVCFENWLRKYEIQNGSEVKDEFPVGEIIARVMSDTQSLRELMTSGAFGILIDAFFVVSCLVSFIKVSTSAGIILSIAEIIAAILLVWGSKYMRIVFHRVRAARAGVSKVSANVVGGLTDAYYMVHENYASKKGKHAFDDFLHKQLHSNVWDASYYSIAESLYPILLSLVVFTYPYTGIAQAATILVVVDLIQRSIDPIKQIAGKIANIQRAATGIERIISFNNYLLEGHRSELDKKKDDFIFKHLEVNIEHFQYPKIKEEDTNSIPFEIGNVSFSGHKGQLIGLVGMSGCGKSTVLKILSGSIIPQKGNIKLVGQNKSHSFPGSSSEIIGYREHVGIVSQDSHIFSETLRFNITMTKTHQDGFDDFWSWILEQIPYLKKWDIDLEDKVTPSSLSLGQCQLVSAIRSCYLKKPMVLFDEISSALDSDLEEALRKVILLIQKSSLTIIVAHRIETIIGADLLLVMDNGRVEGSGKHDDLIQTNHVYKQFIQELNKN